MRRSRLLVAVTAVAVGCFAVPAIAADPPTTAAGAAAGPARSLAADTGDVRRELGLGSDQRLIEKDRVTGPDGKEHVRYTRTVSGLEVLGGDLVVHRTADGAIDSISWAGPQGVSPTSTTPAVSEQRAVSIASRQERRSDRSGRQFGTGELVVDATSGRPHLAWRLTFGAHPALRHTTVVTADTGRFVRSWKTNPGADGTGRSVYSGTVPLTTTETADGFALKDGTRGNMRTRLRTSKGKLLLPHDADNTWGNGKVGDVKSQLADVHHGGQETWDFYQEKFDRFGIYDDGRGFDGRLEMGWGGNAFWDDDCQCFTVGGRKPFLGSVEVVGHEATHGVVSSTSGLNYYGDAGGLNESSADIMGTLVEFYADNPADPGDYRLGEQFYAKRKPPFLRRMDKPSADKMSYDCYSKRVAMDDPHYSSGIGNHFFYLLAQGTGAKTFAGLPHEGFVCSGSASLTGLGNDVAGQIWYDALSTYMVSSTDYPGARTATVRAAIDRYGADSTECAAVEAAWTGVQVPGYDYTCAGPVDPGDNALANGGFEKGLKGWKTTAGKPRVQTSGAKEGSRFLLLPGKGAAGSKVGVSTKVTVPDSETALIRMYVRKSHRYRSGNKLIVSVRSGGTQQVIHRELYAMDGKWKSLRLPLKKYAGTQVTLAFELTRGRYDRKSDFSIDGIQVTPR